MTGRTFVCITALAVMAIVCRAQPFTIHTSRPDTNGILQLSFAAQSNTVYDVFATTNIVMPWRRFATFRAASNRWTLTATQSTAVAQHYFRVADLSDMIVVEGFVETPEGFPVAYVIVSNSLSSATTHTDFDGHYFMHTYAANNPTNFPFTLYFTKPDYRPVSGVVGDAREPRVDYMEFGGPGNNDFTNRYPIVSTWGGGGNHTEMSSREAGEPGIGNESVWFSYVPELDGTVQLYLESRAFRPVVSLFTGSELESLQPRPPLIYSNYVEHRNVTSGLFTAYAGEELQIRVAGEPHIQTGRTSGYFTWTLSFVSNFALIAFPTGKLGGTITIDPPPNTDNNRYLPGTAIHLSATTNFGYYFAGWSGSRTNANPQLDLTMDGAKLLLANFRPVNDNFADALQLTGVPAFGRAVNRYATREPGEPEHCAQAGGNSVWWRWTAPSNMSVRLNFGFVDFTALLAAYTGSSVSNLTLVANNAFARNKRWVTFDAVGGTTYHIAVDGWHGDQTQDLSVTVEDVFEARYVLHAETNGSGTIAMSPPADGNDQFGSGESVLMTATPAPGFRFEAWCETSTGDTTNYTSSNSIPVTLHSDRFFRANFVATNAAPANDNFAGRFSRYGEPWKMWVANVGATAETNEMAHGGVGGASTWWSWVPLTSTTTNVSITRQWASFHGVVAVYREVYGWPWGSMAGMTPVTSARFEPGAASAPVLSFGAQPGYFYHIAVDTYDGSTGTAELVLRSQ